MEIKIKNSKKLNQKCSEDSYLAHFHLSTFTFLPSESMNAAMSSVFDYNVSQASNVNISTFQLINQFQPNLNQSDVNLLSTNSSINSYIPNL